MPAPKNGKSILMTPDPYHIPGYRGFCPQFKFQFGKTFGCTTSKLLTSDNIAPSGRAILSDINPGVFGKEEDAKRGLLQERNARWGDQKLGKIMVPGYTGYIPKGEHYYGSRYAKTCLNAIADFEKDQIAYRNKVAQIKKKDIDVDPMKHLRPMKVPYVSPNEKQHSTSPYYMKNNDPGKCFVSGYTGFVPKARNLIGMGYPIITHEALNSFTGDLEKTRTRMDHPVKLTRLSPVRKEFRRIYTLDTGLVPHYTGHIPGQKFRYGTTFGHSTRNAKRISLPAGSEIIPQLST
ncbi:protein FAM166B-like [Anneissia japonica]|uniref:protein FAM166B-like n=1 Tax=Anneissia japonica TaxID=1529436 RepID=UPI00142553B6|nr:protein FAM166B-like [Anneissia japonica]